MNEHLISVVLATRDRRESLRALLEALLEQVDAPGFEVVIADNGSNDGTYELLNTFSEVLSLRRVFVPQPGKGRALNAGLQLASGEFVVFTDDDVIPDRSWLREWATTESRHPNVDVFGGRILTDLERVPSWIRRSVNLSRLLTGEHDFGDTERLYPVGHYPFGPNMAIRRERLARVERPYPEDMGPGTALPVGDETKMFVGLGCGPDEPKVYAAHAVVWHAIESENIRFRTAVRRCFLAGRAAGQIYLPASAELGGRSRPMDIISVIWARVRGCRSLREMVCVVARYVGYVRSKTKGVRTAVNGS